MTEDTDMTESRLVKITVYTPGTYAGKRHVPGPDGLVLQVTPHAASQFRQRGACRRPDAEPADALAPADTPARVAMPEAPEVPVRRPPRRLWPQA